MCECAWAFIDRESLVLHIVSKISKKGRVGLRTAVAV